ncbi:MAG TPA: tetratricopeptide repeat protein [Sandaracinaceae bacterium]
MNGAGPSNLDARLLRFRSRRGGESAAQLASDLLDAGRGADALEVAAIALAASPDDVDVLVVDGRARLAAGDLLGAQAALLKAAKVDPNRKEPFRWLGEVLLKRGDPARAIKVLERALAIDARDAQIAALHQRAERLARIAAGADSEAPESDERTVVRTDLTEQLRQVAREVDAKQPPKLPTRPSEPPVALADVDDSIGEEAWEDAPTTHSGSIDPKSLPPEPPRPRTSTRGAAAAIPPPGGVADAVARAPAGPPPLRRAIPPKPGPLPAPAKPIAANAKPAAAKPHPFAPPAKEAAPKPAAKPDPFSPPAKNALAKPAAKPDPFAPAAKLDAKPDPFAPPARPATKPAAPPAPDPFPPAEGDLLSSPPAADRSRGPAPEPARPEPEPFALPPEELDEAAAPSEPAADVPLGGAEQEDVDAILRMLREQGLFEPPSGEPAQWAPRREARKTQASGTRIGLWLGAAWVLAIGLAVGGWYGWQWWVERQHQQAAALLAQAKRHAWSGTHADLVDAERLLREARELHPTDVEGPKLLLFVHAQRALEDGAFEAGYLRPTIARAEQLGASEAYLAAARAVLSLSDGGRAQAREQLAAALAAAEGDAAILYLAGRLEQRLGGESALEHLQAAVDADAELVAPRIALAEARYDEGQAEEALALIDAVLGASEGHLRARLWRSFMTSDTDEPAEAIAALGRLETEIREHGAPTDRVLMELTRARLLRRQGQAEPAGRAVDEALRAGATEPRLLALVASEGRRAGRMVHAEQAARAALSGAPESPELKKLLAGIQIARRNGRGALSTLAELDAADPDVLEMRAQAALLVGTTEALQAAAEGLEAAIAESPDAGVALRALRIRTRAQLGNARDLVAEARALAREAPGDPAVALALGEAALLARDARTANEALAQAVLASPDDAEAHYLLGRAKRLAGDAEGAEQALRRAVELTPEHTEAQLALGGLLLDRGNFQAADALYTELTSSGRSSGGVAVTVAGRLGRVEALIGLGRLDDAAVQLEQVRDAARETPSARMTAARLALARHRPGDALTELRPIATAEGASATVLALYGDALLAAGQREPAAQAYAGALAQDGGLPEALLGQAELAVRAERGGEALELLAQVERALETRIRPPSMRARLFVLRGRAQLLERDPAAARATLEQAAAIEGAPAEAHFFLGEALSALDSPDARAAYQRYLELGPEGPHAARARRAAGR